MLERLTERISDPDATSIDWNHTEDDIVEGVEVVFAALQKRGVQLGEPDETIQGMFELLKLLGELTGEAVLPTASVAALGFLAEMAPGAMGYAEAAEQIARDNAPSAFTYGIAMGVMSESVDFIGQNFWKWSPDFNPAFEEGGKIAQNYYNAGLVLGYDYGRDLRGNMSKVFFNDLKRVDNPSLLEHGDESNFSATDWRNFYIDLGVAFRELHIQKSE
jgi:hypothetical protein